MSRAGRQRREALAAGYAHPNRLNEHSEYRWWKRHRNAWTRALAVQNLIDLLPKARLQEIDNANLQAIWRLPTEDGYQPILCVDHTGLVKTVLPRHASYDAAYGGHP